MSHSSSEEEKKVIPPETFIDLTKQNSMDVENYEESYDSEFYIVGIGTSAGGLQALQEFFDHLDSRINAAYVIVQHLSPDYKSLMAELVLRHTDLPVHEAEEGVVVEPRNVYLIPSKSNITIQGGRLHLEERSPRRTLNLPIDLFFRSLALDSHRTAIAIVLSGTGSDGSKGIRAIHKEGGTVLVQDKESAAFTGMPISAMQTGVVSMAIPPARMGEQISTVISERAKESPEGDMNGQDAHMVTRILQLLKEASNSDFTAYKRPTIYRRMKRRMVDVELDSFAAYYQYLKSNREELETLAKEFLIGTTQFFRDREAFDYLANRIIPEIVAGKSPGQPIKVWSMGCSTGEEPYSLSILFQEELLKKSKHNDLKVFATDIDEEALEFARDGCYRKEGLDTMPIELVRKYFSEQGEHMLAHPAIRSNIIFSKHNMVQDPPFTKMDLVVCRNVLIYMQQALQLRVFDIIRFSLKLNGYLFLGSSENTRDVSFDIVEKSLRIYKNISPNKDLRINDIKVPQKSTSSLKERVNRRTEKKFGLTFEFICSALLRESGAACVLVNENYDILEALGSYRNYLDFPDGKLELNLKKMMSDELAASVITAVIRTQLDNTSVYLDQLPHSVNGEATTIRLMVEPFVIEADSDAVGHLIVFNEDKRVHASQRLDSNVLDVDSVAKMRIEQLEAELKETKLNLKEIIEQVEVSGEELQSTNEELIASNEELQSTNEELQSVNEELHTVNFEFQSKNKELTQVNDDIEYLISSTDIGTLFLDINLCIRRYTPSIREHFELYPQDIGRHISTFSFERDVAEMAKNVLETLEPIQYDLVVKSGRYFQMRVMPFRTYQDKVEGIVITFLDFTDMYEVQQELRDTNDRFSLATEGANDGVIDWPDMRSPAVWLSPRMYEILGVNEAEEKMDIHLLDSKVHYLDRSNVRSTLRACINKGTIGTLDFRMKAIDNKYRWFRWRGNVKRNEETLRLRLTGFISDIDEEKHFSEALNDTQHFLNKVTDTVPSIIYVFNHETMANEYSNREISMTLGYSAAEVKEMGDELFEKLCLPEDVNRVYEHLAKIKDLDDSEELSIQYQMKHRDGSWIHIRGTDAVFERDEEGNVTKHLGVANDVTTMFRMKEDNEELEEFTYIATHDLKRPITNIQSFLAILREEEASYNAQQLEVFDYMDKSVEQARTTIADLLHLAKSNSIEDLSVETCDIQAIFEHLNAEFAISLEACEGEMDSDFSEAPEIVYYASHLRTIFHNLISNSIKYRSSDRKLKIVVRTWLERGKLGISVADNGIGIDLENDRAKVFGLFKRAHSQSEGSGMGMYMVKRMVERNRGKIDVESEVDRGSTFHVLLNPMI